MTSKPNFIIPKTESWKIFNNISKRYDMLNRVLSFGMDIHWRQQLIEHLPQNGRIKLLDLATGTGDVVITLVESCPHIYSAVGVDMARSMLDIAQEKTERKKLERRITLERGDAQDLSFQDNTFDALTMAFGIRNIPDLRKALMEIYRVLRPGGRALILEFSQPANPVMKFGYILYLRLVVPLVGFLLSGNYSAYRYLNQTVEDFPYGDRFCKIIKQMGFKTVKAQPLFGGVATIYVGEK